MAKILQEAKEQQTGIGVALDRLVAADWYVVPPIDAPDALE